MNSQKMNQAQAPGLELHTMEEKPVTVSLLINSVYYFIESVLILETTEGFRLLAIHQNKLIADETYKTAKSARIAFMKLFNYKAYTEGVKAQWTPFYAPEEGWETLKILENQDRKDH